jgi:hypothetical protein
MAGDWIKLECSTPDKPEVYRMADALGIAPEHVVGCLIAIWVWVDQQTTDGNAVGVTRSLLDRKSGVTGFAQVMADVGWLVETDNGLEFPNFDRHNGKTAKSRALTAKRVAKHKRESNAGGNATGNGASVTGALPREEKRREEKERGADAPTTPKTKAKKGERIPDGFPAEPELSWAKAEFPAINANSESAKFRDYWVGVPGQKGVKLDWPATWRNWIRRCADNSKASAETNRPELRRLN